MMAELNLGFVHNNKTVSARVGDTIVITLPENATTGFQWNVASITEETLALEDGSAISGSAGGAIGAGGGGVTFRFRATSAGNGKVTVKLSRGGESDNSAFQFTLNLDISR
jgi:inhibitor of cysteine peptidase